MKLILLPLSSDLDCSHVRDSIQSGTVNRAIHYWRNLGVSEQRKYTNNYNLHHTHSYGPINILNKHNFPFDNEC
jgi:hypothetical protein